MYRDNQDKGALRRENTMDNQGKQLFELLNSLTLDEKRLLLALIECLLRRQEPFDGHDPKAL